jgi:hypothetical protein
MGKTRLMVRKAALLSTLLLVLPASAAELFPIYEKYVKAVDGGDLSAAKALLSAGKLKALSGKSESEALSALSVISPKADIRAHEEILDGDDATLIVGANVAENPSTGRIEFLREKGRWKIVSEMWDLSGAPEDAEPAPPTSVRQAENDEQREALRELRAMGYPMPEAEFLVMSAVEGKLDAVKLFIKAGYSPDTKSQGSPAIVSAAMFNQPDVVDYLIEAGADVNATDDVNTTALMRIAEKCDATASVRKLLKAGAKTDVKSAGGSTAAQLAEWSGCKENLKAIKAAKR